MEAVTELSAKREAHLSALTKTIREKTKGYRHTELFNDFQKISGYAHYKFTGEITDKLIELLGHEPTSEEVILIVDDGYSHFGASCSIYGRHFGGRVNTD